MLESGLNQSIVSHSISSQSSSLFNQTIQEHLLTFLVSLFCILCAVNCVSLAQLLSLCGFVAFWQVSHLERSVSAELRRRRGEKEEKEEKGPVNKNKVCIKVKMVHKVMILD